MLWIREVYPGSRILIFYPSRIPSQIPDPKTSTKERGEIKICWDTIFVATNFTKLNFLPKNLSLSSINFGFGIRDPESEIRNKPIPDPGPGIKKAPDPWSRIRKTEKYILKKIKALQQKLPTPSKLCGFFKVQEHERGSLTNIQKWIFMKNQFFGLLTYFSTNKNTNTTTKLLFIVFHKCSVGVQLIFNANNLVPKWTFLKPVSISHFANLTQQLLIAGILSFYLGRLFNLTSFILCSIFLVRGSSENFVS